MTNDQRTRTQPTDSRSETGSTAGRPTVVLRGPDLALVHDLVDGVPLEFDSAGACELGHGTDGLLAYMEAVTVASYRSARAGAVSDRSWRGAGVERGERRCHGLLFADAVESLNSWGVRPSCIRSPAGVSANTGGSALASTPLG